ncbi:DUF3857 domain-containing protein [Chitinophaga sp. SYP-B3965]|uniref:DUF3857 domain-containing protein n=1 Tax=Chitinophaga sp. SYP-B3965 TaxID=2663120 RepID=UPI0012999843|nr:DUF3857 domain-containing protein [Chitinophaga sp. SYP-B3965]MRG43939.1 DUF3857 domain-containing protein [Chitinophaga sp. SYP-B3965]
MRNVLILLLISTAALAGDPQFPVSAVPAQLLKNADVVKRREELTIRLIDLKDVRVTHRRVVTILNENGDRYSGFAVWYDKFREVKEFHGVLYDASGKQLRKTKNSDVSDVSAVGESNLMDDRRRRSHNFYYKTYPYTVEYEVEYRYRRTFSLDTWVPQGGSNYAVEQSRLSVTVPEHYDLRYRSFRYPGEPLKTAGKGDKTFVWEVKDIGALREEPLAVPWRNRSVMVYLSPSEFAFDTYTGKMNTWDDYGKFQLSLNAGRDVLPEKTKAEVHQLTDGLKDRKEKVKVLYQYMQQHTRYISIQLGIGGWQPFDATSVATNGYGDCKALSNYMYSLLKEAGIRSHYTIVKAGSGETDLIEDFAVNQFNHIILCVPMARDTTWLECTSQDAPAGYLSDFTSNRTVLVIDETGGKLVRTPTYTMDQNLETRYFRATINAAGDLSGKAETRYTGLQQDWCHDLIHTVSPEKQLEVLKEKLSLASYDINKFQYKEHADALPVPAIDEALDITVASYASVSGKRLFLVPNVLNRSHAKLSADEGRQSDILLETATRDMDTVELTIPEGYKPESVFPEQVHESKFGKYMSKVKVEGTKVTYVRSYERKAGIFPAKDFALLEAFFDKVYKADRSRIILVKAE